MQIAEVMKKMVAYSEGNTHDINHLLKVWAYAKTIGELENWMKKHREFWRWRPYSTILPARFAGRSMAIPMVNTKSRKVCRLHRSS